MVVRLTLGKEKYKAAWEDLAPLVDRLDAARARLARARRRGREGLRRGPRGAAPPEGDGRREGRAQEGGGRSERRRHDRPDADGVLRARGPHGGARRPREGKPERGLRRVGRRARRLGGRPRRARKREDQPARRLRPRRFSAASARTPTRWRGRPARPRQDARARPRPRPRRLTPGCRRTAAALLVTALARPAVAAVLGFDRPADAFEAPTGFHLGATPPDGARAGAPPPRRAREAARAASAREVLGRAGRRRSPPASSSAPPSWGISRGGRSRAARRSTFANEGWFQRDSYSGGADKASHIFFGYFGTSGARGRVPRRRQDAGPVPRARVRRRRAHRRARRDRRRLLEVRLRVGGPRGEHDRVRSSRRASTPGASTTRSGCASAT